jgi:hypothetical protein
MPRDGPPRRYRNPHAPPAQMPQFMATAPVMFRRETQRHQLVGALYPTSGVRPSPSADSPARPTRFSAHPRRDRRSRERARRASTSPATVATVGRGERHRCISPALTGGPIDEHTINWRKYSHLLTAPEEGGGAPLHLSRFRPNSLIYKANQNGRAGRRAGPRPLHLSRQGVARLPTARGISPGQALHLSTGVLFFSINTTTCKPLL